MMRRHYHWLDTMRAVAMLLVVCGHFRNALFPEYADVAHGLWTNAFYALTRWGHSAVIVFFVLSGFLVGGRAVEQCRAGTFNLKDYALARAVRIGLPLAFACGLSVVVLAAIGAPIPWRVVLGNLFCLQGLACDSLLGPWWALSVEVWFYVFGGALLGAVRAKGWGRIVCLGVCMATVWAFFATSWDCLVIWIMGALAFLSMPKTKSAFRLCMAVAAVLACVAWLMARPLPDLVLGAAVCLLVREAVLWEPTNPVACKIEKGFDWLAKFSYTTYLLHMLVMIALMNGVFACGVNLCMGDRVYFNLSGTPIVPVMLDLTRMNFGWYAGAVVLALVVSYAAWWLVERNTGKVLKFLKDRCV